MKIDTGVLWRGTVDIVIGLLCSFAQTPANYAISWLRHSNQCQQFVR